ncbi:hypothetical protein Tco_0160560, partial [Tanacetum coccineum]
HPRNVKSSLNKKNGTVNVNGSAVVQNIKKQDNSDSQGRRVIPFHHFINNDLEYLRGGVSSRKYSTSHLEWITVRRDDDVLYKFKEGDFHRLRIQDIEDILLLLVQGKMTNLNVEERIAFNVSLRMFTRSVVIQRRVEDHQLGVESYQKKLNLTKPDTYRSNLRRRDAYTLYSDPRGFVYENKDKKNRLMRIDELHKFSDGTLDDVRNASNDRTQHHLINTQKLRGAIIGSNLLEYIILSPNG